MNFLQNCDLPPPIKFFSPVDKIANIPNKITAPWDAEIFDSNNNQHDQNTNLLKALRLSQSRAREAEKKMQATKAHNEQMISLLLDESLRLSAHKQWVKLLEMEVLLVRKKNGISQNNGEHDQDGAFVLCFSLAVCFSIGFALGRCMF